MRRVIVVGTAVALGDGVLLGATLALGWTILAALCAVIGIAGAAWVATTAPPPRAPARPSTVTLGLPVREIGAGENAQATDGDPDRASDLDDEREIGRAAPLAA